MRPQFKKRALLALTSVTIAPVLFATPAANAAAAATPLPVASSDVNVVVAAAPEKLSVSAASAQPEATFYETEPASGAVTPSRMAVAAATTIPYNSYFHVRNYLRGEVVWVTNSTGKVCGHLKSSTTDGASINVAVFTSSTDIQKTGWINFPMVAGVEYGGCFSGLSAGVTYRFHLDRMPDGVYSNGDFRATYT